MCDILSNFGQEKITDCLQVRIEEHKSKSEDEESLGQTQQEDEFICCTYGDAITDG